MTNKQIISYASILVGAISIWLFIQQMDPMSSFALSSWINPLRIALPFVGAFVGPAVISILLVAGIWYYLKDSGLRLVGFLCSLIFAQHTFKVGKQMFSFLFAPKSGFYAQQFLMSLFYITLMCFVLRAFQQEWSAKQVTYKRSEASNGYRFLNYFIDLLIFAFVVYQAETELLYQRLLMLVAFFLYYYVFERVYLFTPGKIATNSIVESEDGTAPTDYSIFIRSISRLIPFEGLSFFGDRGFHDRFSNTRVIRFSKDAEGSKEPE